MTWEIDVLETFQDIEVNGGVLLDRAGNIYGTTGLGRGTGCEGEACWRMIDRSSGGKLSAGLRTL